MNPSAAPDLTVAGDAIVATGKTGGNGLAATVIGLGAFLLFAVQPLVGKYLLPWFGGTAGVWTTCLLFFQILLLAGYLYAHALTTWLVPRGQKLVHLGVLIVAAFLLPANLTGQEPPPAADPHPILSILRILVRTIGLPGFLLATTSPLLQKWHSQRTPNPYRFYAVSNFGSLGGLLAYPVLIEPSLPRSSQVWVWSILCWVYLAAFAISTIEMPAESKRPSAPGVAEAPWRMDRVLWIVLPAVGSMLLLATTNKLCQDLAPVPLLWLLPLGLYLLTFIASFDHPRWYCPRLLAAVFPLVGAASLLDIMVDRLGEVPMIAHLIIFNTTLLAGCLLCHGELARRRPPSTHLTHYYLSLAGGGAMGGALIALGAPLLLRTYSELQLTLLLCLVLIPIGLGSRSGSEAPRLGRRLRSYLYGSLGCLGTLSWVSVSIGGGEPYRNFYGVVSIIEGRWRQSPDLVRLLQHGQITHGTEFLSGPYTNRPSTYYGSHSGIGRALRAWPPQQPKRVGVLGLGIGNLNAYAQPQDDWVYYEINPTIIALAQNRFDEFKKHPCRVQILAGDARQTLAHQTPQHFDFLVVDVFNGDSIPTHLLTLEAVDLYRRHLKPDGTLAIHISNRYLDLEPVVRQLADRRGFKVVVTKTRHSQLDPNETKSVWAILTAKAPNTQSYPRPPRPTEPRVWTDDYTAILPVVRWGGRP